MNGGPRLRLTLLVGTIAVLTSQSVSAQRAATPAAHEITDADLAATIGPVIENQLTRLKIAGAVVVVVKNGSTLFARGYGYADVESRRPMTADKTLVRPGSISKLFTGIAVMQLVEQGKLDLDRDVNDYLDFHVPTPDGGVPVTLRRLIGQGSRSMLKISFRRTGSPNHLAPGSLVRCHSACTRRAMCPLIRTTVWGWPATSSSGSPANHSPTI
jgi:beta-lactamase family protein